MGGTSLLEGKAIVVTGGASGIGRAACFAFVREGARVLLADLDANRGEETAEELRKAGGDARFESADVSDEGQVEALVATALGVFGRIDGALNNAGVTGAVGPLHEIDLEGFERTLRSNLTSIFLCMKHEIRAMLKQGGGAIVNTASGAGVVATPTLSSYCSSKHGVLGLTKTAAVENARTGIRVNAICPGSIDTPMLQRYMGNNPGIEKLIRAGQPGGRLGRPDEIAEAAVWLLSDRASFVSGASLFVDGGAISR